MLGKKGRNVPNLDNLLYGEFTPLSFSEDALDKRANSLVDEYKAKGIDVKDRKSTRLNSSHRCISYAVFCLKKKKKQRKTKKKKTTSSLG